MRISARTTVVVSIAVLLLLGVVFGPLVLLYVAAFGGVGFMVLIMVHTAFIAARNWQLDKLPGLHAPRLRIGKRTMTRRAA